MYFTDTWHRFNVITNLSNSMEVEIKFCASRIQFVYWMQALAFPNNNKLCYLPVHSFNLNCELAHYSYSVSNFLDTFLLNKINEIISLFFVFLLVIVIK